ncbi:N-acetyltransferase [Jannaschia pagri]|uniref:N-acetyltransferase n=1 Tax=Jannaschia pagri TaxID=2829797 RepID=A0ABQ4NKS9_9RHOB|nr:MULTISPECIES: GNAT family N-acetyltransferase [unclassified Jannaschia]GIT91200.1 N-acetyltransferase [Jannaschia sp. AI_61]GIT95032.1 N-acetyltransferase [Jannaschia sp. AI_62]
MIPTLTTERLTLRAPETRDHAAYAAFYASPRSEIIGGPLDETAAWKILTNDVGHWHLRGFGWWSLDDGTGCVGSCGFHLPEGRPDVELGWSLFSGMGRGYATEAAQAALAWAGTRWPRIVSHIDRDNRASARVALRLGATDTGVPPAHDPLCTIWLHDVGGAP